MGKNHDPVDVGVAQEDLFNPRHDRQ
jgi:hypothetical protein